MMWRTVVILLFCFACITFAEVNEKHQKEQDLIAFETWFKGLLAERVEELKVVPREVGQAGVDRDAWRGLFATESVEVGDTVLVIPWHLMITLEKIRLENPEFKDVVDQHKLNIQEIFSLYLIYLKYCNPSNNFFAPWVKILPTKFSSILHFTADELSLLKGSFLGSRAVWRQQQSKANYDALAELVFPSLPGKCSPISYDDWRWAESVVDSRMIDLINDGTDNVRFSAIAPYFDMFNHENPVNGQETWGYNSRKMILHAEAGRNHNPSEQLFISYGTKCNDELLEKYGFLIETNDDRCVHIDIYDLIRELDEQIANNEKEGKVDELLHKKKILLMDKAQKSLDYSYQILPNGVTEEVIFAAEILSYEEDATVGQVNLNRVKWLINRVEKILKGYPTTAEQDDAIMDSPTFQKISKRAQLAIALRKEEKELLGEVLEQYKEVQASILRKQEAATETPAETHATIVKETPKEKEEL